MCRSIGFFFAREVIVFYLLSCTLLLGAESAAQPKQEKSESPKTDASDQMKRESAQAASEWLKILDEGRYGESWDKSSALLKLKVPKQGWIQLLNMSRRSAGSAGKRELSYQGIAENPVNLPHGEYMVNVYKTKFSAGGSRTEMVLLYREPDGKWRAINYYIK